MKTRLQAEAGAIDPRSGCYLTGARAGQLPTYRGLLHGWYTIATTEGALSLYRGAGALVVRGAMFSCGQLLGQSPRRSRAALASRVLRISPKLTRLHSPPATHPCSRTEAPFKTIDPSDASFRV